MADSKSKKTEPLSEDESPAVKIKINLSPAPPAGPYKPVKYQTAPEVPKNILKLADLPVNPPEDNLESKAVVKKPEPIAVSDAEPEALEEKGLDPLPDPIFEDQKTEEAVNDIATNESDAILALEDLINSKKSLPEDKGPGLKVKLKALLTSKWTWVSVLVVFIIIFLVPFTRYKVLGLFIKKPVVVTVLDSSTDTPVSSAEVSMAGANVKTNAIGIASLKSSLGSHKLIVTKSYYKSASQSYVVGFKAKKQPTNIKLIATGRLVPVTVLNTINSKPIKGVSLNVDGTLAKTNSKGQALVALPTTETSYNAKLTSAGYNNASDKVTVTNQVVKANSFNLTPAGDVYFLNDSSGNIDVDKANLDGSTIKTILPGTGDESSNTTVLFASRDWKYLVLEANRSGNGTALYLINTSNNKLTEFDNSPGSFTPIGWSGHNFIYDIINSSDSDWQSGRESLKSYNADTLQLNQLDQNQASGSSSSYSYQSFTNFYILNNYIVYTTSWTNSGNSGTSSQADTIRSVETNGENLKDYESFSASSTSYIQAQQYSPLAVYFSVYDNGNDTTAYYSYSNQAAQASNITQSTFKTGYTPHLVSPSGNQTLFEAQSLSGQGNALFIGNGSGGNGKQIASLTGYTPRGWYSDDYILLTKSSELYIMPSSGLAPGRQPIEISRYFQPELSVTTSGYSY